MGACLSWRGEREGKISVLKGLIQDSAALGLIKFHSHSSRLHSPYHSSSSPDPPHTAACCHFAAKQQAGHTPPSLDPFPPASFPLQTTQARAVVLV